MIEIQSLIYGRNPVSYARNPVNYGRNLETIQWGCFASICYPCSMKGGYVEVYSDLSLGIEGLCHKQDRDGLLLNPCFQHYPSQQPPLFMADTNAMRLFPGGVMNIYVW